MQATVAAFERLLIDRNPHLAAHSRRAEDAFNADGLEAFVAAIQRALATSMYPEGRAGRRHGRQERRRGRPGYHLLGRQGQPRLRRRNGSRIELIEGRHLKSLLREHLGLDVLISLPKLPPGWERHEVS